MSSYSFGYLNFGVASGSHYSPSDPNPNIIPPAILGGINGARTFPGVVNFVPEGATTTITESLTIKYFQRVYDDGTEDYCYYTKTEIDPTPTSGETTPNYTGTISDHSVVKILEIY
jgi:hypothetical protein